MGAHLIGGVAGTEAEGMGRRERDREVDSVVRRARQVVAIEARSGARRRGWAGLSAFCQTVPGARPLVVGAGGVEVEAFLDAPIGRWFGDGLAVG